MLYLFFPRPDGNFLRVKGYALEYRTCRSKGSCSETVQIEGVRFDCRPNPMGSSGSCPKFYKIGEEAIADYYLQPTLLSFLTGSPDIPILIKFKQGDVLVYSVDMYDIRSKYIWPGSDLLCSIFIALFIAINQHSYFRKEV